MALIRVVEVWEHNLVEEMKRIRQISKSSGFVSIDTEFPGTVFKSQQPLSTMIPDDHYRLMKHNVDATHIIQLGLTLSDSDSDFHYVWEFNFRDFDPHRHIHNPDSVALLQRQGIDFSANNCHGIAADAFGELFVRKSGLVGPRSSGERAWITFHGLYDLGYLIKIMIGRPLPEDLREFMLLVEVLLGSHVYDLKAISYGMGMRGGLEKVAEGLGVERGEGNSHQAGSDSLLTMEAFARLVIHSGSGSGSGSGFILKRYSRRVYGLTWLPTVADLIHNHNIPILFL